MSSGSNSVDAHTRMALADNPTLSLDQLWITVGFNQPMKSFYVNF